MQTRAVILAAALMLPLNAQAADLVGMVGRGYYPEEDKALAELAQAFEGKTGLEDGVRPPRPLGGPREDRGCDRGRPATLQTPVLATTIHAKCGRATPKGEVQLAAATMPERRDSEATLALQTEDASRPTSHPPSRMAILGQGVTTTPRDVALHAGLRLTELGIVAPPAA